jgi:hypothetical protein
MANFETTTLGVPIAGIVIAITGAWIAWQQKRIAHVRLQHDLYDRRAKVFDAARKFLATSVREGDVAIRDYFEFLSGTSEAVFLFRNDVIDYLDSLRDRIMRLRSVSRRLSRNTEPQESQSKLAEEEEKLIIEISLDFEIMIQKFKPYMRLDKHVIWGN